MVSCGLTQLLILPAPFLFPSSVKDDGFLGADLSLSSCVLDLPQGPCRNGVCSRALVHFSPITDFVRDGNRTTEISVKSIETQNFLWSGYSPEPVEVNRQNGPGSSLYIHRAIPVCIIFVRFILVSL